MAWYNDEDEDQQQGDNKSHDNTAEMIRRAGIALAVVFGLFVLNPIFVVGPGTVGVLFNKITGATASYAQGLHFRVPVITAVYKFDVKTQRVNITADSASKDLQTVTVHAVLNYHLSYEKVNELFVKVGADYVNKVVDPAVNEAVKSAVAQYPVENIIVNREQLKEQIEKTLAARLAIYNIIMESLNLVNIQFAAEFNQVVEQKQIEEQKIKTAQYQRMQAEENKKRVILDAEGEARKQELLKQTVSDKGIALQWIAKWDGRLPQYMMGEKTTMMITPNMKSDR